MKFHSVECAFAIAMAHTACNQNRSVLLRSAPGVAIMAKRGRVESQFDYRLKYKIDVGQEAHVRTVLSLVQVSLQQKSPLIKQIQVTQARFRR